MHLACDDSGDCDRDAERDGRSCGRDTRMVKYVSSVVRSDEDDRVASRISVYCK
jgi:hypothetical protein